jgi:hypothetical protein
VGLKEGLNLLEIANLPSLEELYNSFCRSFMTELLALRLAFDRVVVLKGIWHSSAVASFASSSALSLPGVPSNLLSNTSDTFFWK